MNFYEVFSIYHDLRTKLNLVLDFDNAGFTLLRIYDIREWNCLLQLTTFSDPTISSHMYLYNVTETPSITVKKQYIYIYKHMHYNFMQANIVSIVFSIYHDLRTKHNLVLDFDNAMPGFTLLRIYDIREWNKELIIIYEDGSFLSIICE
jgi:hypothetical protein